MPTFRNTLPSSYLSAYKNGTECSETLAYTIQTPENYPEESIQHSAHGESLKSRILNIYCRARLKMHWRLSDPSVAFSGKLHTKYFQLCFRNVHVCYKFLYLHVSVIYSQGSTSYTRRPEKLILLLCLPNGGACGHEAHERRIVGSCIPLEGWVYILQCVEADSSSNARC